MRHENLLNLCGRQNAIVASNPWAKAVTKFEKSIGMLVNITIQIG
jgi:hypothetical protein